MVTDDDAVTKPAQRVEVFTGTGRRRAWLHEEKARIVAEIASSGDSVCAVARRHGLSPQQLFGWRRRRHRRASKCRLQYRMPVSRTKTVVVSTYVAEKGIAAA
jgi:transposase-like protein